MEKAQLTAVVKSLLDSRAENKSLSSLVHYLHSILYQNVDNSESTVSDLIDPEFMREIIDISGQKTVPLYFGKSLRNLKCVLPSETVGWSREIEIFIQYKGPKKLCVTDANLPKSVLENKEYSSLKEIISTFENLIHTLLTYLHELERIDRFCTVMEPAKPTFRDDFRRILLDDRTWLHVKVTPKGFATDIHLVGNTEKWAEKLQAGLLDWNHEIDIVENITNVFDTWNLPSQPSSPDPENAPSSEKAPLQSNPIVCNICCCSVLMHGPAECRVPLPLCLNPKCEAYFHRDCLYEWLLTCSGSLPPAFGVANGTCPTCGQPTSCCEKET